MSNAVMVTEEVHQERIRSYSASQLGLFAEKIWEQICACREGMSLIPLHRIFGVGAPLQVSGSGQTILPDFEVSTTRRAFYLDSKGKMQPVLYRHANEIRHGIHARSYYHYCDIQQRSGKLCFIGIFECFSDDKTHKAWSGSLLLNSLPKLGEPHDGFGPMRDTVFWPRDKFVLIGTLTAQEARDIANRVRKPSTEITDSMFSVLEENDDMIQRSLV